MILMLKFLFFAQKYTGSWQTSYLSKDLRDRNFGPQKFTQKKTEFAIKQVRDKIM